MKKIEKLIHINTDEKQHVSPDTVFEMCCKINEIIDFLNQLKGQQVELTNKQVTDFVKHTDQNRELNQIAKESEKQPERCDCDYCKAYRFSMEKEPEEKLKKEDMLRWLRNGGILKVESEKQNEGEKTDLRKEIVRIFAEEEISLLLADSLQDKLVDFISKLLKEKTFSKEELNRLSIWSGDVGSFGVVSDEDAELINKIYKLLDGEKE